MPRNSSGTMTLPSLGVPFQSGTTVSSAQMNATLTDLATETTSSLDRAGRGAMLASLRVVDGTAAAPALAFGAEPASGIYRAAAGDVRLTLAGVDGLQVTTAGLTLPQGATIKATGVNAAVPIKGNLNAADVGAEILLQSTNTRTAGLMVAVQNPAGNNLMFVDYQGLLRLANTAALQPASIVTTITPDTNIAAGGGLGYWKDSNGMVHMHGTMTNNTGSTVLSLNTANPIPAGFRPAATRGFSGSNGAVYVGVQVTAGGLIQVAGTLPAGATICVDSVLYLAAA